MSLFGQVACGINSANLWDPGRNGFTTVWSLQWNIQNLCILWPLNIHFFIFWGSVDFQVL